LVTAATGKILVPPNARARAIIILVISGESLAGDVFGMASTAVKPPAAAA
jgi:hypothetical protein